VQLVERPQIAMGWPLGINTSGTECIVNPLHYRSISVIALNHRLEVGHARLLCNDLHAPLSHAVRRSLRREWCGPSAAGKKAPLITGAAAHMLESPHKADWQG
jgi:hypothetical protein